MTHSKKTKRPSEHILVKKSDLLASIKALNIFYEHETARYLAVLDNYGEEHPAVTQLSENFKTLGNIIDFISNLAQEQEVKDLTRLH
jgi:hypothetical protein